MKKSTMKLLCAALSLVMIFAVLPMSAFATPADEHVHTEDCCAVGDADASIMLSCPEGKHVYKVVLHAYNYSQYSATQHRVEDVNRYECIYCPDFYDEVNSYTYDYHTFYRGTCTYCGYRE